MEKNIAVRARKEIIAIFNQYATLSEKQDKSRPQAIVDFVTYVANLSDSEAGVQLKAAAVSKADVDGIGEIPQQIRIVINIDEAIWNAAIERFKMVFDLGKVQMPFFIRVCGLAYINNIKQQRNDSTLSGLSSAIAEIEAFKKMNIDDKLTNIYSLLIDMLSSKN
ncbi:MAG: hypothetical protein IKJ59_06515 [Clostridia bacterium]|nr:hypothetical protein [Clostridia bacterium]